MADNGETKHCPNCKREISTSNFMTHEIHCKRHISLCEHCKEPVPKGEMEIHFEEIHAKIKCPKCGSEVEKTHFEDHEENECPKRPMKCLYCELELPKSELKNHQDYCGSRTEPCVRCGQYIMLKDQIKHEESKCTYPPVPVKQTNGLNAGSGLRNNSVFSERETITNSFTYEELNRMLTDPAAGLGQGQSELPGFVGASGQPVARFRNKNTIANDLSSRANEANSKSIALNKSYLNRQRELASLSTPDVEMDRLLAMQLQHDVTDNEGDIPERFYSMEKSEPLFPPYEPGFNHSSFDNLNIFSEDMSLIPCEFCGQPYPADDLVLHQSACGHDVIGLHLPHAADDDHSNNRLDNRTEHMPASPRQQPTIIDNLGRLRTDELDPEFDPFSTGSIAVVARHVELLPCEFCDVLFPEDLLFQHQPLCDKNATSTPRVTTPATRTTQPKKKLSSTPPSYDIPNMRSHRHQPPPHLEWQEDSTEDQTKSRSSRSKVSSNIVSGIGAAGGTRSNLGSFGIKYGGKYDHQDRDHGSSYPQPNLLSGQNLNVDKESTRNVPARIRKSVSDTKTSTLESLLKETSDTQQTHDLLGHVSSGRKNQKNDMNSLRQKNVPMGVRGTSNPKMTGNARGETREQDRYGPRPTPGTQSRTSRSSRTQNDDGDGPNSRPQRMRVNNVFTYNEGLASPTNKRPSGKKPDAPR
ncbi:hypothetical protein CHS0354_004600 [Potamilus streckersoni]|uniref:TRAF-type domain-containing protein n=1 Tax=Potamilus streckersoni TaxID=2493646 RepID=A0AAE0S552_9BIVA|nr:hypothetical protein CHS0354_004600 [Potamilus streckersoni]